MILTASHTRGISGGHDQGNQGTGNEESFLYRVSFTRRVDEFDAQSNYVGNHEDG
jgi:hypothetical protein